MIYQNFIFISHVMTIYLEKIHIAIVFCVDSAQPTRRDHSIRASTTAWQIWTRMRSGKDWNLRMMCCFGAVGHTIYLNCIYIYIYIDR